jgi:hypothetical protein
MDVHSIIVWGADGRADRLNGEYVRDEAEQATYLRELLEVFEAEGVDAVFVYTFARYDLPHREDPRTDLDLASRGVVKVLDGQSGRTRRALRRHAMGAEDRIHHPGGRLRRLTMSALGEVTPAFYD